MKIGDEVFVHGYIDEIRKYTVIIRNNGGYFGTIPSEVITGELPSAQPEHKKGKWIKHPEWQADGECGYECDQCGMGSDVDYDFCMRCGADMRQGEKDE